MSRHKPESPTDLTRRSWMYVLRKTGREFTKDECTDLAAALTYYAVLSAFPAAIAMLSLVGVFGQGKATVQTLLDIVEQLGGSRVANTVSPPLEALSTSTSAGFAFVFGVLVALWSASGYVGAFGRALNRMYGVKEGRPFWKLRPLQVVVTLVCLVFAAAIALALVLTGPAARAVGNAIGLGDTAVLVWDVAKWPVILVAVMAVVATLYYATPNVKQPKFRWISPGAVIAILVWVLASAAFGVYVSNFGSFNKTYGTLAGAVIFLLWLWLTNLALLFGAELDCELERGRELQAGLPAERHLQLPLRDTRNVEKFEEKEQKYVELGRELREAHATDDVDDDSKEGAHAG